MGRKMKYFGSVFIISFGFLLAASPSYAYQIIAEDMNSYVFKGGRVNDDPNRYRVIYEVDELNKTITSVKEIDLRTSEEFAPNTIFQIVDTPTIDLPGVPKAIRGYRINPKRGNIEAISFCNGEYHYSKTTEEYINLFHGKYQLAKQ